MVELIFFTALLAFLSGLFCSLCGRYVAWEGKTKPTNS